MTKNLSELIDTLDVLLKPLKREQTETSVLYIFDCGIVFRLLSKPNYIRAVYCQLDMRIDDIVVSKPDKMIYLYYNSSIIGEITL